MNEKIENVIKALKKNNIDAIFVSSKTQAQQKVREMLFDGATITLGGSVSVKESGVFDILKEERYNLLDRNRIGITEQERFYTYKETVGADFYFCSTNALTENGELINVDGNSNRVSAIAFGPKRVVMIVGTNKIVKDTNEGFLRVKKIAAPKNCERLKIDNPCRKLGHCMSFEKNDNPNMTDGCNKATRICSNYLVSAKQKEKGRITVILVDENLGY